MDDDNTLMDPEAGVPHSDASSSEHRLLARFSGDSSSVVHNPYGCFGAPGVAWPRGYPLSEILNHGSTACEVEADDGRTASRIGVVQALANHDPDVDAIYRLTHPPGGLPFSFDAESSSTHESPLRGVPAQTMTPYNAQVSTAGSLVIVIVCAFQQLFQTGNPTILQPNGQ